MSPHYVYLWEYDVPAEHAAEFEQAYGPQGDWVQLFRRGRGHLGTELHRDLQRPERYLTIDRWESRAAWEAFRAAFAREFEDLDARCGKWTRREAEIGRFEPRG